MHTSPRETWTGRARPRRPLAVLGSVALGLSFLAGTSAVAHAADAGAVERAATNEPGMSIGVDGSVGGRQVAGNHSRFTVSWNKLSHGA
jgi:hypothetical protein